MGYLNTHWDLKLFYKWINGKPLFVIAHSDDFRWFRSEDVLHEWDALLKNFDAHKYTVTDCADKELLGINIVHDADFNYYIDQTRMITEIIKEAKLTGARTRGFHIQSVMTQSPRQTQPRRSRSLNALSIHTVG